MEDINLHGDEEQKSEEESNKEANDLQIEEGIDPVEIVFEVDGNNWVLICSDTNQEFEEFLIQGKIDAEFSELSRKMER